MKVTLAEVPGRCRWCGCTDQEACIAGCSWSNKRHTLCSECVLVDRLIRSKAGRRELASVAYHASEQL